MTLDRVAILLTGSCAFFTFPGDCPARLVAGRNGDSVARTGWFQLKQIDNDAFLHKTPVLTS
jgi:hypothetical protein